MLRRKPKDKKNNRKKNALKRLWYVRRNSSAHQAVETLITNSRLECSFFVMCGLSGLLATTGILLNDVAILIAAMVLAPLLNPVLAIAAGISMMNRHLITYALKSFVGSVVFVILLSALMVYIWDKQGYVFDISQFEHRFSELNHVLFTAAFISGFSGVYAWLRAANLSNLIGVAIAVSLIPFVSFFGVLLGLCQFEQLAVYLTTFLINIFTIIAGATTAFIFLGLSVTPEEVALEIEK